MHFVPRLGVMSVLVLLLVTPGWTQLQQKYRIEIPSKASHQPYDIISLGTEGLAFVRDLQKYTQGNKKWSVELVDTTLTRFWSTELELENRLNLVGFEHLSGRLYLLFRETQTTFNNFQLATFEFAQQSIQIDKVRFDLNFQLTHFTVAGRTALFGGYVNSEPAILLFDHTSDKPKILPGLFTKNISLLDVRANQNQSFNVLLVENRRSDKHKLILRTYDSQGNLLLDDIIEIDARFTVLSGITSCLVHEEMMIVGTYGEGTGNHALGIYSLVVDPFNDQPVTYTDLASIDHFLDYLPEKKAAKVRSKVSREKSLGKVPGYKADILPIRLEEIGSSYYVFVEMFHPPSNATYYPYGSPAWNDYYNSYNTPGYVNRPGSYDSPHYREPIIRNTEVKMIQSLLLRFKSPAAIPEGLSMKFDDVRRPVLNQTGDFLLSGDSVVLAYKKKSEIIYQKESGDPMIRPSPETAKIAMLQTTDVLKDEDFENDGLRSWYGSHGYVWGYRRVRATVNDDVESRYVFYVNRLDF